MSWNPRHTRLTVILGLGLVTLLVTLFIRSAPQALLQPDEVQPPGRWHFQASRLADSPSGDELARVLSLPYVSGRLSAPAKDGVILYLPELVYGGLNLYVSGHGPEAILVDMDGSRVHSWIYPFERAFPLKEPTVETHFFRRAHLYPNGELLVLYQGGGIIKLDRQSNLIWASDLPFYNHLYVAADGTIVAIAKTARLIPSIRSTEPVLEDSIVTLSAEGELLNRLSILDCFANSDFSDLIHPLPDHSDIFHTNTVVPITDMGDTSPTPWLTGDLLVSLREVDIVALIDPAEKTVRSAWRGPWRAQHQPIPLPTQRILLFDNRGAKSNSRVVEFDPFSGQIVWEFSGTGADRLGSPEAGSCQRLPNGNTLITDSEKGRALEITTEEEVVWEFVSPHRAGARGELVATLFEVIRIPASRLDFVPSQTTD